MRQTVVRGTVLVYSALLVSPVVPLVAGNSRWLLVAGLATGAVVGALATAERDMNAPEASWTHGVAGLVVPLGWLLPAVGEPTVRKAVLSPWAVGASASIAWLFVVAGVGALRNAKRRENARTIVAFSARPPKRQRRHLQIAVAAVVGVAGLVVAGIAVLGSGIESTTLLPLTTLLTILSVLDEEQEMSVTDRGLIVESTVQAWEKFEGYEHTEDTLVVTAAGLGGTRRFDTDDIDDVDAVVNALDDYLPRLAG